MILASHTWNSRSFCRQKAFDFNFPRRTVYKNENRYGLELLDFDTSRYASGYFFPRHLNKTEVMEKEFWGCRVHTGIPIVHKMTYEIIYSWLEFILRLVIKEKKYHGTIHMSQYLSTMLTIIESKRPYVWYLQFLIRSSVCSSTIMFSWILYSFRIRADSEGKKVKYRYNCSNSQPSI